MLILTKPRDVVRTLEKDERLAAGIRKKYPLAADQGFFGPMTGRTAADVF